MIDTKFGIMKTMDAARETMRAHRWWISVNLNGSPHQVTTATPCRRHGLRVFDAFNDITGDPAHCFKSREDAEAALRDALYDWLENDVREGGAVDWRSFECDEYGDLTPAGQEAYDRAVEEEISCRLYGGFCDCDGQQYCVRKASDEAIEDALSSCVVID